MGTDLASAVLLLIAAEQEDLSLPDNRRRLAECQEETAQAALSSILRFTVCATETTSHPG